MLLTEVYQKRNITICLSLQNCFTEESNTTEQKVRVCHENQNFDFLIVFLVLLNFLSLIDDRLCKAWKSHRQYVLLQVNKKIPLLPDQASGSPLIDLHPLKQRRTSQAVGGGGRGQSSGHLKEMAQIPCKPIIEFAVQSGYAPILDTVARIKQTNPDVIFSLTIGSSHSFNKKTGIRIRCGYFCALQHLLVPFSTSFCH